MGKKIIEHNELIAVRIPPGDKWSLVGDSKLYAIQSTEEGVLKEEPKMFSLYGEFKQGT